MINDAIMGIAGTGNSIVINDDKDDRDNVNINDQGNGLVENKVQGSNLSSDGTFISAPLRLTGGGDTSFDSQEEINFENQGNSLLDNSDANCSNDVLSFINQDNSMSEQDIRDVLFEAGYSIDAINEILISKAGECLNESASQTLSNESVLSESESGTNSAYDVLREIRVKNVN